MNVATRYRSSGADVPFGSLTSGHGVAMEGYFWRFTDPVAQRAVIALIGVQQSRRGPWALVGLGAHPGQFWRQAVVMEAQARRGGPGAKAGSVFLGAAGNTTGPTRLEALDRDGRSCPSRTRRRPL